MSENDELAPLRGLLNSVLGRLNALEQKVGIETTAIVAPSAVPPPAVATVVDDVDDIPAAASPSLSAYDTHVSSYVVPFATSCDKLGGLDDIGSQVLAAWGGIRSIIALGTKCKKPSNLQELAPYLKPTQDALTAIRQKRLKRDYDWHYKAIMEMLVICSWVMLTPPQTPTLFVKEAIGSTDYWSNRIRKQYKGKDETQIAFCDTLKAVILDLSKYVKEYHLSGLSFNPRGIPIADYVAPKESKATEDSPKSSTTPSGGGGIGNVMAELAKKRTSAGDSAASGLKKVTKEQQTWRKEFKKDAAPPPPPIPSKSAAATTTIKVAKKAPKKPICEYQTVGNKWVIENQTKDSNPNGMMTIDIKDPKHQAYIYNCSNTTFILNGKIKTIILDKCTKCNMVFDTVISSCEIVNSQRIQVQVNGICPSISIDKTDGCLAFLGKETIGVTSFMTSKSSEMNVNWEGDDGEVKEAPLPEQFQHKLVGGVVNTTVSDLYTH